MRFAVVRGGGRRGRGTGAVFTVFSALGKAKKEDEKELYEIAQEIDLEGRSTMNKAQLLKALQEHAKS